MDACCHIAAAASVRNVGGAGLGVAGCGAATARTMLSSVLECSVPTRSCRWVRQPWAA